eukprot:1161030-Pelagomonas_calceolata.AAC.7
MGMELLCKLGRPLQGMGSVDSPTHTQKDCVESGLSALKLFAQFTVLLLCRDGVVLLLTSSKPLILRSTQCEGGLGGLLRLAGQGVTKIASGRLEVMVGQAFCAAYIHVYKEVRASFVAEWISVRSIAVFNSAPSGKKYVGLLTRMGMKLMSEFNGTVVVQP